MLILKQRDMDLVMDTEYQNMVFSQGLVLGNSFYFFVRMDGTILYASDGVRKVFRSLPASESQQQLDQVLELSGVRTTDHDRLMKAVTGCLAERLVLPVPVEGKDKEFVMTIDPLARPSGVLLVRGREYRDSRSAQLLPDVLRSTAADRLDHLLTSSPVAHFTADGFGQFEYVNPAFEQLLGYGDGGIKDSKIALRDILLQADGQEPTREGVIDFSGNAVFKRRDGSSANAILFQNVMRDPHGKALAVTGSIISLSPGRA